MSNDHQPAVIWCPNCGDSLSVPIRVHAVNQHGTTMLRVELADQYVRHRCGQKDEDGA